MAEQVIVVGVDGSEGGRLALDWALQEAERRGDTVRAIATWHWEEFEEGLRDTSGQEAAREYARAKLDSEIEAVLGASKGPSAQLSREVIEGSPADVLVRAAADADLLVLGSHGHGRLRHRALGSVADACILRASCPVVVVPLPRSTPQHRRLFSRTKG